MSTAARTGNVDALQKQLTKSKAAKLGIYKGMTQTDVLTKVFSIAFSKPLAKTEDAVTVSETEIGYEGLEEFMLSYAKHCKLNGINGGAQWVTDMIANDAVAAANAYATADSDSDSDSDDSGDDEDNF